MVNYREVRQAARHMYEGFLNGLHRPLRQDRPDPFHQMYGDFQNLVAGLEEPFVLELGSRNVTGVSRRTDFPGAGRYLGCDIHPGDGVDMVADAHRLSDAIQPGSVDAITSVSVFEHLAFPWKAALEINRVLKPGGLLFIATHPMWPAHELPWDFWRYPVAGLTHLFSRELGFEVIAASEGLPCKVYGLATDGPVQSLHRHRVNAGVALIARKIADYDPARFRWDVDMASAVVTEYPAPSSAV